MARIRERKNLISVGPYRACCLNSSEKVGFTAEDTEGAEKFFRLGDTEEDSENLFTRILRALRVLCDSCFRLTPAASAWGFDANSFSGIQADAGLAGEFLFGAITPHDYGAAGSGVGSARQAIGAAGTTVG